MGGSELLILLVGSGGILAFLGTVITLAAGRKKLAAETSKIDIETRKNLNDMQRELSDDIREERDRAIKQSREFEKELDTVKAQLRNVVSDLAARDLLVHVHTIWDNAAAQELAAKGSLLGPPPSLLVPPIVISPPPSTGGTP